MREESSLKSFLRFGVYCYNMLRGYYWQFMAKHFPAVNAKEEMKRQKQTELIREADIRNPIYFNEKMLWLKYHLYNKSDIVAMCYNKYMVREYVENKGLAHILNKLYFVSERIEDIPWSGLPEECVIKLSNGYYGHVFKRKDAPFDIEKAKKILRNTKRRCSFAFRISGDLFVYGTKPVYVCEKLIKAKKSGALPDDYKIHCFHGVPRFLEYIHDRNYENKSNFFENAFIDIANMVDRSDLEGEASPIDKIVLPSSFDEMLECAKKLSADFPYVRVDFYEENGHPVFGELTFTPYHLQTKTSLKELGVLIHLEYIEKYKRILIS